MAIGVGLLSIMRGEDFTPQQSFPAGASKAEVGIDNFDQFKKSAALDTDESFSHTFTTAGNYTYFCSIHPHMTGKIIVK